MIPFYQALLSDQPFESTIPLSQVATGELFSIDQEKTIRTNKVDAKLDYYWVLNKKSNLNVTLGTTQSGQRFNSGIFEVFEGSRERLNESLPNPNQGEETQSLRNDVAFHFSDVFLGLHYKVKTGKVTWTPGVTLHNFGTESTQQGSVTDDDEWIALPDLFVNIQFGQTQSLRFNYQANAQYTDVTNYAEGLVFNNFNSLFRGNRNLENALFHNVSLNYFSFSAFSFTNFFGGINYTRRIDPIKTVGLFQGINQISSPVNNSNFDRQTENFTQSYRASFATNFDKAPNLEVGFNRNITNSDNGVSRVFTTDRPFANFEWAFGKGFIFTADWEYFNYDLKATNLFDVDVISQNTVNDITIRNTEYFVQPRIVLLTTKYNL